MSVLGPYSSFRNGFSVNVLIFSKRVSVAVHWWPVLAKCLPLFFSCTWLESLGITVSYMVYGSELSMWISDSMSSTMLTVLSILPWRWVSVRTVNAGICSGRSRRPSSSRRRRWTGWKWGCRCVDRATTCWTCWFTARTSTTFTSTSTSTWSPSKRWPPRLTDRCPL